MVKIYPNCKVKMNRTISNADGTLYKESIVKIETILEHNTVRVIDNVGKMWVISIDSIEAIND